MAAAAATAPAGQLELYPSMRLQRLGSIAVVQPVWQGEVAGPSLTVDLETGTVALAEHPKVPLPLPAPSNASPAAGRVCCCPRPCMQTVGLRDGAAAVHAVLLALLLPLVLAPPFRLLSPTQTSRRPCNTAPLPFPLLPLPPGGQGLYRCVRCAGPGPAGGRAGAGGGDRHRAGARCATPACRPCLSSMAALLPAMPAPACALAHGGSASPAGLDLCPARLNWKRRRPRCGATRCTA